MMVLSPLVSLFSLFRVICRVLIVEPLICTLFSVMSLARRVNAGSNFVE